ncbi:nitroreductase family protein [Anaerococcus sp.]|uniref:nitroreductase family protein n=1 Tax=Anaerococcus sp. TaxID=1872515 RepID=UPI00280BDB27|nr:nitroreductase family protein [Anaerococcus sp.]MDU3177061.1 nitroreductase family protein [Anaerococcus sp.]
MLTTNFLKSRTSTRDYKEKQLDDDTQRKIYEIVYAEAEKLGKEDLSFLVNTDGDSVYNALEGVAGYRGIMIKAPAYIALNSLNNNPSSLVKGAYGMEEIITKLNDLGLGSCWITVADVETTVKQSAFNFTDGDVNLLLAFGYPLDEEAHQQRFDNRLATEDLVFLGDFDTQATDEDLEQRGLNDIFDYAKFAPSTHNEQPWRFVIVDDKINLYIEDFKGDVNLIDAGIIMYYIDELGKSLAMTSGWDVNPEISSDKYTYIATKKM